MKKIIAILALTLAFTSCTLAQSLTPRFGILPKDDNTGRVITYGFVAPAVTATTVVRPNKSVNVFAVPALTLSPIFNFTTTASYAADESVFTFSASAATRTVTFGGNVNSAGTYTLGSGKAGTVKFIFNGTKYVEVSRFSEP